MARTKDEMLAQAREATPQVTIEEGQALLEAGALALDVREPAEFQAGHLPAAVNIPRGVLEFKLDHPALLDTSKQLLVYCKSGGRGALAAQTLHELGFTNVSNLVGGITEWSNQGQATEKSPEVC